TPGNEPYEPWQGVDRQSAVYESLKKQRAEVMWQALERIIPDVRSRCWVNLVGTPLTHERFLRRHQGTYGPAFRAGKQLFPGPNTPLPGFWCCGDSTFPGIGLPAVATSGMIVANTIAPINKHLDLIRSLSG
ncbi:MAG: carotene isomerase, partial [Cyanothece sp. SIO2G6]|nr:carotene isomerase [Cyanothece sp. SIO2G6]